jgi:hypothetical protein
MRKSNEEPKRGGFNINEFKRELNDVTKEFRRLGRIEPPPPPRHSILRSGPHFPPAIPDTKH